MGLTVLVLGLITVLGGMILRRPRFALVTLGLTLTWILLVGGGILPQIALDGLQTFPMVNSPEWNARNAIVVLGAGSLKWPSSGLVTSPLFGHARVIEAARLYLNCRKAGAVCKVLATGGDPSRIGLSEAQTMARELEEIGVGVDDILVETKSNNTFQNAQFSAPLLKKGAFDRIYVVTSGFHLSRSLLYFSHFQVDARPAPADRLDAVFTILPLSYNFTLLDIALHEHLGVWRYHLYNVMGWNAATTKAGVN